MLMLSLSFFSTAVYFRIQTKQKNISILSIAPTLFQLDIYQHRALAYFSDKDGQFKIAKKMIRQGIFSRVYSDSGTIMLKDLAESGHAPSQTYYANILIRFPPQSEENRAAARNYLQLAAAQNYTPAQEILNDLDKHE